MIDSQVHFKFLLGIKCENDPDDVNCEISQGSSCFRIKCEKYEKQIIYSQLHFKININYKSHLYIEDCLAAPDWG